MTRPPDPSLPPASAAAFDARLQAMRQTLEDARRVHREVPLTSDEREQLKQAIIVLFREADAALQQAQGWKDAV